jgi:hypothetical protein
VAVVQPNDQLLEEPAAGCLLEPHSALHIAAGGINTCADSIAGNASAHARFVNGEAAR